MFDVVGIGECVIDLVGMVNSMPDENTKKDVSIFRQFVGGRVVNSLLTLANLGCQTALIGTVGDDEYGQFFKHALQKNLIDTYNVKENSGKTPFHFVVVSKNNHSRTTFKKKSTIHPFSDFTPYHQFVIKHSKVLSIDRRCDSAGLDAVRYAKKNRVSVSFDPSDKYNDFVKQMMRLSDIFIAPHGFIKYLKNRQDPKKALLEIQSHNKGIAVLTLGPEGCIATDGKSIVVKPRYNKRKVVDTNGAGDVFHGAFIYGILHRWSLGKTCEFANKIAALKCSILGNNLSRLGLRRYA